MPIWTDPPLLVATEPARKHNILQVSTTPTSSSVTTQLTIFSDTHDLDASKVPPSVFAARQGEPEVLHGDHSHNHAGRHGSVVSNQNQLSGV